MEMLVATGVTINTPDNFVFKVKIVDKNQTNFDALEIIEKTEPLEKIALFESFINRAHVEFCDNSCSFEMLDEILENVKKINKSEYERLNENYSRFKPYEPLAVLQKLHPNFEEYVNTSLHKKKLKNVLLCNKLTMVKNAFVNEYAKSLGVSFEEANKMLNKITDPDQKYFCCKMFGIKRTYEWSDCRCGFSTFEDIKEQLDKHSCFENISAFAKRFLFGDLKIVGLKQTPPIINFSKYII